MTDREIDLPSLPEPKLNSVIPSGTYGAFSVSQMQDYARAAILADRAARAAAPASEWPGSYDAKGNPLGPHDNNDEVSVRPSCDEPYFWVRKDSLDVVRRNGVHLIRAAINQFDGDFIPVYDSETVEKMSRELLSYGNVMGRIAAHLFGRQNNVTDEECVAKVAEIALAAAPAEPAARVETLGNGVAYGVLLRPLDDGTLLFAAPVRDEAWIARAKELAEHLAMCVAHDWQNSSYEQDGPQDDARAALVAHLKGDT